MNHLSTAQQDCDYFIKGLFDSFEEQIYCIDVLTDAILHAHSISPVGWSITKFATGLRLNVGPVEVMEITKNRVFALIDASQTVPSEVAGSINLANYSRVRGKKLRFDGSPYEFRRSDAFVRPLLMKFISRSDVKAGGSPMKTEYASGFSPEIIEYISRTLRADVPYPSYWNGETHPGGERGDGDVTASEGTRKMQLHHRRERNQAIVKAKKVAVFSATGDLACEGCGFSFFEKYGNIGKDVCEVHHRNPLGENGEEVTTRLDDLAIVCSNCHTIIHKSNPMLTVGALRGWLISRG